MVEPPPEAPVCSIPPPEIPAKSLLGAVILLGVILGLLGSVLPVWGYHRLDAFVLAGNHFLAMALGLVLGNSLSAIGAVRCPRLFFGPLPGCVFLVAGVALFALLPPPFPVQWQLGGALCLGLSLGSLAVMIFHHIGTVYRFNTSTGFQFIGLAALAGVFATPVVVALFVISSGPLALLAFAAPGVLIAGGALRKMGRSGPQAHPPAQPLRSAARDFRSPAVILLAILLFFQLGSEVSVVGWLPIFLIQRVGMSPALALYALAAFVFALLAGRTAAQALHERARRNRIVLIGLAVAILGCLMLLFTNNVFGAFLGAMLAGFGFAPVLPMAFDRMNQRFPYYHTGVINLIFTIGLLGGLLAPYSLGLAAGGFGIGIVMLLPIAGSVVVSALVILMWLEARLTGSAR